MMQSLFGNAPSVNQTPVDFGARMSPIITPSNIFEGQVNLGSSAIAGPSLGGLRGRGEKTLRVIWKITGRTWTTRGCQSFTTG